MKVKTIQLGLENCEVINIPYNDIKGIHLNGISKSLYKPFETSDELKEVYMCDDFDVTIDKNANVLANCQCFSNTLPFERLKKFKDVTFVCIQYENGSSFTVYTPYEGDETNTLQTLETDIMQNMHINIKKENYLTLK